MEQRVPAADADRGVEAELGEVLDAVLVVPAAG